MNRQAFERPPARPAPVNDPGAGTRPAASDPLSDMHGSVRTDPKPAMVGSDEELACRQAHGASQPVAESAPQLGRSPGILVVDDEAGVCALLKEALGRKGFIVWLAGNGRQALDLYRELRAEIDVVLLDVQMPQLDGPHTLTALQQFRRGIRCCFMTADTGAYTEQELRQRGALHIFRKPFRLSEVARMLWDIAHDPEGGLDQESRADTLPELFLG